MFKMFTKIGCICLLIASFVACQKQQKEENAATHNEANIQLVKAFFAFFNQHDWENMAKCYTETANFKDPSLGVESVTQTQQQTIEKYTQLNQVFPDIRDSVVNLYAAGEKHVVVEFISKGTAADGSKLYLPICSILTIENGKITQDFTYYDNFEEEEK